MVILDTNIIIEHLRIAGSKESHLVSLVKNKSKEVLALSVISIHELYEGKSTMENEKEKDLLSVVSPLRILPYTYEIAKQAGIIARDIKRPIELADAAIAATAITNGIVLYTLDKSDFSGIDSLELLHL